MPLNGYPVTQEQVPKHLRATRTALTRWFGRAVLTVFGWNVVGTIPDVKRVLIIAAPHTSNWDFVFAMAAVLGLNLRIRWLGKHTLFKPGAVWVMRWLGGIPTNREQPEDIIQYVADLSNREEGVAIGLAPEGTRAKVSRWKTGFLRIAKLLDCPILLISLDFQGKHFIIGDLYQPTGDSEADLAAIKSYYSGFQAKYPDKF